MERIEDRSKALSYIGIEVAESLKSIPAPVEPIEEIKEEKPVQTIENTNYMNETRIDVKPSLWQKIKQSKLGKAVSYLFKIRIKIDLPNALPEGNGKR